MIWTATRVGATEHAPAADDSGCHAGCRASGLPALSRLMRNVRRTRRAIPCGGEPMHKTWIPTVATLLLVVASCAAPAPHVVGPSQIATNATPSRGDSVPERVVELDHGCKLVIDAKLDPNDAVTLEIERQVRQVMSRVQALIPAHDLTIYVKLSDESSKRSIIPEMGVGGHPIGTDTVVIYIQPENPNFKTKFVAWGLPHEIHHAIRLRNPDWHWSLLESAVMEGLADHFLVEVVGGEPGPWTRALTEEEIHRYLIQVKPLLRAKIESYAEFTEKYERPWFVGRSGSEPIPRWTGYTLGWRIVENYLRAHPEARASSLLPTSAEVIADATPELLEAKKSSEQRPHRPSALIVTRRPKEPSNNRIQLTDLPCHGPCVRTGHAKSARS